jgi:hypothetical protein
MEEQELSGKVIGCATRVHAIGHVLFDPMKEFIP